MITVHIPDSFVPERTYGVDVLLGEFLGLPYEVIVYEQPDYMLSFAQDKQLIIRDHFFSEFSEIEGYLHPNRIPSEVKMAKNHFINESNIPIIYGNERIEISQNEIICGIDIVASIFFMLTRWEEYAVKDRDHYGRFSAKHSMTYRNGILNRPVVNEYVEMVWSMLLFLGYSGERKKHEFRFILTHDVDAIQSIRNPLDYAKKTAGDLLKRKSPTSAIKRTATYAKKLLKLDKDPFDNFDWLMDLSESINVQSRFYFMSGGATPFDNHYKIQSSKAIEIINKIKERQHIIGFHPSFNAHNDPHQWKREKELLENTANMEVTEGRQHFLRFENPVTWSIWDQNHMSVDSTLSYADQEGFRCGVCYEFSTFNILTREKMKLKERPLIAMEVSFVTYQNLKPNNMERKILQLIKTVKRYNGNFVLLWHNSSFNDGVWLNYDGMYNDIIKEVARSD